MNNPTDRSTRAASAAPRQSLPYDFLGMDAESLKRGHPRPPRVHAGRAAQARGQRVGALRRAGPGRARPADRALDPHPGRVLRAGRQARLLPVARVPDGPHARQQPRQPRAAGRVRARRSHELGYRLEELREAEWDAGSATAASADSPPASSTRWPRSGYPPYGYGIRYDYGIFHQRIVDGAQVEAPDGWLRYGNPWEIARPGDRFRVQFYGRVDSTSTTRGRLAHAVGRHRRRPRHALRHAGPRLPHRRPSTRCASGRRGPSQEFDLGDFNEGDYIGADRGARPLREHLPRALPERQRLRGPGAAARAGVLLRRAPPCRTSSAATRSATACSTSRTASASSTASPSKVAIQLNDTHPALAIAGADADPASTTRGSTGTRPGTSPRATFGYTNHTVMPEALERWPVAPPRPHAAAPPADHLRDQPRASSTRCASASAPTTRAAAACRIIEEGRREARAHGAPRDRRQPLRERRRRAAHRDPEDASVFRDFYELWPEQVQQQDQRHHPAPLAPARATRALSALDHRGHRRRLGHRPRTSCGSSRPLADDAGLRRRAGGRSSAANKERLAATITAQYERRGTPIRVDPDSLFDVPGQAHPRVQAAAPERAARDHPLQPHQGRRRTATPCRAPSSSAARPRPATRMAKLIIRLINAVGDVVNDDPAVARPPEGRVPAPTTASRWPSRSSPAPDLSEQISTAGTEASGTGNMKFALNGALTIGTLDGANIEIREEVGDDNIFIFGLTADEVAAHRARRYDPRPHYRGQRGAGARPRHDRRRRLQPGRARPLPAARRLAPRRRRPLPAARRLRLVRRAARSGSPATYRDHAAWTRMSILNVAHMGKFSSDRTIRAVRRRDLARHPDEGGVSVARGMTRLTGRRRDRHDDRNPVRRPHGDRQSRNLLPSTRARCPTSPASTRPRRRSGST